MKQRIKLKHKAGLTYKEISELQDIYQIDKDNKRKPISQHTIKAVVNSN